MALWSQRREPGEVPTLRCPHPQSLGPPAPSPSPGAHSATPFPVFCRDPLVPLWSSSLSTALITLIFLPHCVPCSCSHSPWGMSPCSSLCLPPMRPPLATLHLPYLGLSRFCIQPTSGSTLFCNAPHVQLARGQVLEPRQGGGSPPEVTKATGTLAFRAFSWNPLCCSVLPGSGVGGAQGVPG